MGAGLRACASLGGVFALLACGAEEEVRTGRPLAEAASQEAPGAAGGENLAPRIESLELAPSEPRPGETVVAEVTYADPNGDEVALSYLWRVNGIPVPANGDRLHVQGERGSEIEVEVTPRDAELRGESATASASVGNFPPVIHGLELRPGSGAVAGRSVTVSPRASDADGDPVDFEYAWYVNGSEIFEARGPMLEPAHFATGDEIQVRVIASDGFGTSDPLLSDPIGVGNATPRITSIPPAAFDEDGVFRYTLAVEDADDTRFRYLLVEGPEGMELDLFEGQLTWHPAQTQAGRHPVTVEVSDRKGKRTTQTFAVQVSFLAEEEETDSAVPENQPPASDP